MEFGFVVVDRFNKYSHFLALKHPYFAKTVADSFLHKVRLYGIPFCIVLDRHKMFLSKFWCELFRWQDTQLNRNSAYHLQSDGQSEVVNCCLETYPCCFISQRPRKWSKWLSWVEYWYNTSFHSLPFKVVYGRDPPPLIHLGAILSTTSVDVEVLSARDVALTELRYQLLLAQNRMKQQANSDCREVHFEVGDMVFVKLRPYRHHFVAR
ncbi:hypothetical protein Syun_014884 [Stephania yunnanensis]|uniref:Integrase catalytic domain-containing protein n=1 Tax=Stephania yunnanensis TaxID=152371 RepID=A0AAP0JKI1_9MAGN